MRHNVFGRKLNRNIKERKALFRSLISALVINGKIRTTLARAKAISGLTDKIVTLAKNSSNTAVHQIVSFLNKRAIVDKLVKDVAPRFKDKIGGYTRMIKIGPRAGDQAEEVILEWSIGEERKIIKKEDKKMREEKK